MAKLIFYRQKRYDGGMRTGIELDGQPIAEQFEPGEGERDPALVWFLDLRCEGEGVPEDEDEARQWLLGRSSSIRDALRRFAEKLRIGADRDDSVLKWTEFADVPPGVEMAIVGSAIRRVEAREFASVLGEMADHWNLWLHDLFSESLATG